MVEPSAGVSGCCELVVNLISFPRTPGSKKGYKDWKEMGVAGESELLGNHRLILQLKWVQSLAQNLGNSTAWGQEQTADRKGIAGLYASRCRQTTALLPGEPLYDRIATAPTF